MSFTIRGASLILLIPLSWAISSLVPEIRQLISWGILFILGLIWLDWRLAGPPDRFRVERTFRTRLSLGANNPVHLRLQNKVNRPTRFKLRDEPPQAFEGDPRIFSDSIAGGGEWAETYYLVPNRRGDYRFDNVNLRWQGPFGLIERHGSIPAEEPVKVFPNLIEIERYDILLRRNRIEEIGLRQARRFGEGTEFERLRDYQADDGYRQINWKATARIRRPIVAEYQPERSQNLLAVVDTGRMMQSRVGKMAKLDYVVNAVLMLSYVALNKGDKFGLLTYDQVIQQFLAPEPGYSQFLRLLETLYNLESHPIEPDHTKAISFIATRQRRRALIIFFTDLHSGYSMQRMAHHLPLLARYSLPLVVTIADPAILQVAQQTPKATFDVYSAQLRSTCLRPDA
jgi:uncharacterized protein (DUF58 family)